MYHYLITDSFPTEAVAGGTVTEVDGEVASDVPEDREISDMEHVNFIRIWGYGPQLSLVCPLNTWEMKVVLKLRFKQI